MNLVSSARVIIAAETSSRRAIAAFYIFASYSPILDFQKFGAFAHKERLGYIEQTAEIRSSSSQSNTGVHNQGMLYWEARRRFVQLRDFRKLMFDYFDDLSYWNAGHQPPVEGDKAQRARHEINLQIEEIVASFNLVDRGRKVVFTAPPALGSRKEIVDVTADMFQLYIHRDSVQMAFDAVDRAIGQYGRRAAYLRKHLFDPLFWGKWLFAWIVRIPFQILGAAGFNAGAIERSLFGRLVKAIEGFILFLAGLLTVLQLIGLLDHIKAALHAPRR